MAAYLQRKIDQFLLDWRANPERLPLLVRGPRQVGKTESILHFAKAQYASVVEINFVSEPLYRTILQDGYTAEAVVRNISLIDPSKRFEPGRTLLFFDEVQSFPDIATTLKFFAQDGRYDVICSGSLLGLHYKSIHSNSVGYKEDYILSSLDFEEFLWAKQYGATQIEGLLDKMLAGRPFSDLEMEVFSKAFLEYCVLGGMPAVVRAFIEQGHFGGSLSLQRQLLLDFEEDIRKYAEGLDQARILNVFRRIPVQLAQDNKKFQISKVAQGARFGDYRGCIEWLENTGLVLVCHGLNFPELPLKGNYDPDKYKLYFFDTGLLVAMLDDEAQQDLRANRNLGVYKGALYENIVAEALAKQGYGLYYYKREDSRLEMDFFVRTAESLLPVEVKAKSGSAKSLRTLIDSEHYPAIRGGLKFSAQNIGESGGIRTFPYFCAFLLRRYLQAKGE